MNLLARLLNRKNRPAELTGTWHIQRSEDPDSDAGVEIDLLPNGNLQYSIPAGSKWQIIHLTWWVQGENLVTDQRSSPQVEETRFHLEPDGTLVLEFGGFRSWYARGAKRAPAA